MKTIKIELRVDYDSARKEEIITKAAKTAAKHLFTQALMISDKRKPQIAVFGSDFFTAEEEISLADDIPQEPEDATEAGASDEE